MPIYEFKCSKCGRVFEKLRQVSDTGMPECIDCGSSDVKKKFSSFGFSSSRSAGSNMGGSSSGSSCASCTSTNCGTCGG